MSEIAQYPGVLSEAAKGTPVITKVSVGTSVTQIVAANPLRRTLSIFNAGAAYLYLYYGNTFALGTTGYPVPPGTSFQDTRTGSIWYGVSSSGTLDVRTLEVTATA